MSKIIHKGEDGAPTKKLGSAVCGVYNAETRRYEKDEMNLYDDNGLYAVNVEGADDFVCGLSMDQVLDAFVNFGMVRGMDNEKAKNGR